MVSRIFKVVVLGLIAAANSSETNLRLIRCYSRETTNVKYYKKNCLNNGGNPKDCYKARKLALQDLLLNFFHTTLGDKTIPIETIQQYGLLEMGNAFRALFSKKDSHYNEVDFPVECLDYIKARLHKNDDWRSEFDKGITLEGQHLYDISRYLYYDCPHL